jgi:hypothetical protein
MFTPGLLHGDGLAAIERRGNSQNENILESDLCEVIGQTTN